MTADNRLDWLIDQAAEHPLTTSQFAVLAALLALGPSGMAKVTKVELGALIGLKERQVANVLKELEAHVGAFITAQRNGRAGNSYAIRPDAIGNPLPATWRRSDDNQHSVAGIPLPVTNHNQHSAAGQACEQPASRMIQNADARAEKLTLNTNLSENYPETDRQLPVVVVEASRPSGHVLADRIADRAGSPWLDPAKQKSGRLYRECGRITTWMRTGADFELDIMPTIIRMCGTAYEPIQSWNFFEREVLKAHAQRLAAEQPIDTNETGAPDGYGNIHVFPRNAAERNVAIARDHLASWGPALAEAEARWRDADGGGMEQAVTG